MSTEAMKMALEALEESIDFVREDYENAKKLYSNYPSRQARLLGLEDGLSKHESAITAIKQALEQPEELYTYGTPLLDSFTKPAPVQEPVGWMTQARCFVHLHEFTEAEAKLYGWKPVYTTPPAAQRQWVGLNEKELNTITCGMVKSWVMEQLVRAIEAKLKEKNNG